MSSLDYENNEERNVSYAVFTVELVMELNNNIINDSDHYNIQNFN